MKDRNYWTYSERYPRPSGKISPGESILRLWDRLEDCFTALAAEREFRKIEGRHRYDETLESVFKNSRDRSPVSIFQGRDSA